MQFGLTKLFKLTISMIKLAVKLTILLCVTLAIFVPLPCSAQGVKIAQAQPPGISSPFLSPRFPRSGTNFIPSRFDLDIEILSGPNAGEKLTLSNFTDIMVISRSNAFLDRGPLANDTSNLKFDFKDQNGEGEKFPKLAKLRQKGISLSPQVKDSDFLVIPEGFNGTGARTVFVEIVSIDAKSADGSAEILVGQALKDRFPNIYQPALGMIVAERNNNKFPAKSFFIPYGVIRTKFGDFLANAKGFENPIYAFATPPSQEFPNISFDLEDKGESYRVAQPTLLVSVDNPSGPAVARLNQVRFTNATTVRTTAGAINLVSPENQPQPRLDKGETFTNSTNQEVLFPSE
ncbi:hypothetical protein WA1_00895 [Scytonema hofmannii PCC 7110]|uniref:Uncharacterized protein n=1 Tax=Scytonema hofmannii PCC 7110 TaxID=128403 RepID=A0A139XGD1_9CYAN|nr:hypothetical protein [Scytonema hofmannii]KYC43754.1 hypothetical protein WA1_00895 [Scytonema hofmannii PCC 7110]